MEIVVIHDKNKEANVIQSLFKTLDGVDDVSTFDDFQSVRVYLESHREALIVMDADSEKLMWEVVYKNIHQMNSNQKMVLLSKDESAGVRAYDTGIWDYLLKPPTLNQIKRVVEKYNLNAIKERMK